MAEPTVTSASVASNGSTLTINFSEAVLGADSVGEFGFGVTVNGNSQSLTYVSGNNSATATYTIGSPTVKIGDSVLLFYGGSTEVYSVSTSEYLNSFSNFSVTNNSTQAAGTTAELNKTLDGWTLSSTGNVPQSGALSVTLDGWTLSGAATIPERFGVLGTTLDSWTLQSTGVATNTAALDSTLDDWGLDAVGVSSIEGQLNQSLSWSIQAAGNVGSGISAALEATLESWTLNAEAIPSVAGELSVTLNDWTIAATAIARVRKPRRLFASGIHANSLFGV